MGDALLLVGTVVAALGLLSGGYFGFRQIRSTTAADQARAAETRAREIREARDEERRNCDADKQELLRQIASITEDRNYERGRADGLQRLINERGLREER